MNRECINKLISDISQGILMRTKPARKNLDDVRLL